MSSVDERVVKMRFDNAEFKKNAIDTKKSLTDVTDAVDAAGNTRGLLNLDRQMNAVAISASKMSVIATAALATIASKATSAAIGVGKNLLGSITSTIFEAGKQRALDIEQAQFQFKGLGLNVEKTMNSARNAVLGTAYGLQDAASLAAQFGGSGMKAGKQMTGALRAVSGMAAQTGRSYKEIGMVMGGIAGIGRVTSQDLIQFGTRGLNVAAKMADQMGKTEAEVRQMVSDGKISFKDFAKYMDDAFGKNATKSNKTYTGSLANMRAALSRIGADVATPRLQAMRKVFNALTPAIDSVHEALKPALASQGDFTLQGGKKLAKFIKSVDFTALTNAFLPLIQAGKNILAPFIAILEVLGNAFSDAFGGTSGTIDSIHSVTSAIETMTRPLQTLADMIRGTTPIMTTFFKLGKNFAGFISDIFSSFSGKAGGGLDNVLAKMGERFGWLEGLSIKLRNGLAWLGRAFHDMGGTIGSALSTLGKAIADAMGNADFDAVFDLINSALLGGILLLIRKFMNKGLKIDFGDGLLGGIKDTFGELTTTLKMMQTQIQAKTLMTIASAIGILTASVVALSLIDSKKLTKSLAAMGVGFAQLLTSMAVLSKIAGAGGLVAIPVIAASMNALATSVLILAGAVALLSNLDWKELSKGLVGVGALLAMIVATSAGLNFAGGAILRTGLAMIPLAIGLKILASAVGDFADLSWKEIGKGLAALAGAMLAIAATTSIMGPSLILVGPGMVALAYALTIIASAMKEFGSMSWKEIGKAMVVLAGSLAIIAAALYLMEGALPGAAALLVVAPALTIIGKVIKKLGDLKWKEIGKGLAALAGGLVIIAAGLYLMTGTLAGSAALLIAAGALAILTPILVVLGNLSWEQIAKGLVALAGAFTVLGIAGLLLTPLVLPLLGLGAAMLLIGSGMALAGVGALALAAAFTIFTVAGKGVISLVEGMIGLIPQLMGAFANGIVTFATTLAQNSTEFTKAFVELLGTLLDGIIVIMPKLEKALSAMITAGLKVVRSKNKEFIDTGLEIVENLLDGLNRHADRLIDKAGDLIITFISGISKKYGEIADAGAKAVIKLINSIADTIRDRGPELGEAMGNLGVAMIEGLIGGITSMWGTALGKIGDLAEGMIAKAKSILKIFSPSKIFYNIGSFIVQGLTNGIQNNASSAITAVASMVSGQIAVANEYVSKFIQGLDQQAIAAQAKASGLALAAQKAAKEADKTKKNKKDDKQAKKLEKQATKAQKEADKAQARSDAAKAAQDRQEEFAAADSLKKAQMRSEDAQNQMDAAKAAELNAAKNLQAAQALERQAKKKGITAKERKALEAQAKALRDQSRRDAEAANAQLAAAATSAADALRWQKIAGDEAAKAFQEQFDTQEKAAKDAEEFEKLSDAEKAKKRREEAVKLQESAQADLEKAKKLAYTDLLAANDLAQQAMAQADLARKYITDAENYEKSGAQGVSGGGVLGTVVNLEPSEAAVLAFNKYADMYDYGVAAAARDRTVQFTQYNTSPEALNPTEVYRQTNNLLNNAVDALSDAA